MEAVVLLLLFMVLLVIGVPIACSIGLAVLAVLVCSDLTVLVFVQRIANAADNFALLAIPLFILAGELMNRGGMTLRLVDFAQAVIGHIRGGLGHSCVLASLIFANVSGSAVADTTAVGSVMVPAMKNNGYNPRFVASLQASAGLLAPIIPPSILLILEGSIINVSICGLFLAAVVPGLLIAAGLMVMVMSIIVFATVFGWLLAILGVPVLIIDLMTTLTETPCVFLVRTILFVLVLGTVMEVLAIATIFGPLLNTLAIYYGFDPIFFGVIIAITMQLGGITPRVGILLNITCAMAGTRPGQCLGYISLFIMVILSVIALMIMFPDLMMWLPRTFM